MISEPKLRVPISALDHSQGPDDAPLVLLEYGDYQCPYCGQVYGVIKRLQETLGKDLRFVFRNFPLEIQHPYATGAAMAAEAAGLQGKFWEMHDMLYENQGALDSGSLFEYATDLNLDLGRFSADLRNDQITERIEKDLQGGARSGVNGTPGIFINGYRYDGDWSFPMLLQVLTAVRGKLAG